MAEARQVVLGWQANGSTGWGLYGLHLALGLSRLGLPVRFLGPCDPSGVPKPLHASLAALAQPVVWSEPVTLVSALGNGWDAPPPVPEDAADVRHVGLAVFEDTALTPDAVERLRRYDLLVAPSTWVQKLLAAHGLAATVFHQGYDAGTFLAGPRSRADDRFLIFSGGKLEFRKGQDLVVAAFKAFRETPEGKDAVLVTAWHNPWPATMEGIWSAGHVRGHPTIRQGRQDVGAWLAANGVPPSAHLDLGAINQREMAATLRECDVAVQLSRAEGATNMPLVEAMGAGLPVVATHATGQADVPGIVGVSGVPTTTPCALYAGMDGWVDADVGQVVKALHAVRTNPPDAVDASWRAYWSWSGAAERFADLLNTPAITSGAAQCVETAPETGVPSHPVLSGV